MVDLIIACITSLDDVDSTAEGWPDVALDLVEGVGYDELVAVGTDVGQG